MQIPSKTRRFVTRLRTNRKAIPQIPLLYFDGFVSKHVTTVYSSFTKTIFSTKIILTLYRAYNVKVIKKDVKMTIFSSESVPILLFIFLLGCCTSKRKNGTRCPSVSLSVCLSRPQDPFLRNGYRQLKIYTNHYESVSFLCMKIKLQLNLIKKILIYPFDLFWNLEC